MYFGAMRQYETPATLPRTNSCRSATKIKLATTTTFLRSTSSLDLELLVEEFNQQIVVPQPKASPAVFRRLSRNRHSAAVFLRSLLSLFTFPNILPTCRWLGTPNNFSITPSLGRKVTGTLFGNRRGAVSFAVQYDPRSEPVFVIELAVSTATLVKEMASGLLRIALECEKKAAPPRRKLHGEPDWTMYCNGRECGYAQARECNESDWRVLSTVQTVSVGAGVIPAVDDGRKGGAYEGALLYMRARFERVVGNRDSEAFYMLNPDGNGGPELGIFLLRI